MNAQRPTATETALFSSVLPRYNAPKMELSVQFRDFMCATRQTHGSEDRADKRKRYPPNNPPIGRATAGYAAASSALRAYPSRAASAPFTASAESVTVFSSAADCTVTFSAKNRATVT